MDTRPLLRLERTDQELDEEIRAHLAIVTRQRIDAGDAPEAARLNARKHFGNAVGPKNLMGGDEPVQITGANVSADFFRVLRVEPLLGRGFTSGEEGPKRPPLAVLSHGFWRRHFGGQTSVIGPRISIGGSHHEVIGVLSPDFAFPSPRVDVFTLMWPEYSGRDFFVAARLRPGVGLGSAQEEMTTVRMLEASRSAAVSLTAL